MQTRAKLRDMQIVSVARVLRDLGQRGLGRRAIEGAAGTRAGAAMLGWLLGYRRSFRTLSEAERAVRPYSGGGHESAEYVAWHLDREAATSDYAAFFYLRDRMLNAKRIFDLGGNVGNLYYCYRDYLPLRDDATWTVFDLPENIARGRTIATARKARHLRFIDDLRDIGDVDLFIASGSLHYFDRPLPQLLSDLGRLPPYLLINRTPLTDAQDFAVVQDAGSVRVACKLYNREKLIADFGRLGYSVLGQWKVAEYGIPVLDRPSSSVVAYTGMFLERR